MSWKKIQIRYNLSIEENFVFFGDRAVIPKAQRKFIKNNLHNERHLGINKRRANAEETIYWSNISSDIKYFILNCQTCLRFRNNNNCKLPIIEHEMSQRLWEK